MESIKSIIGNGNYNFMVAGEMYIIPADSYGINFTDLNYHTLTGLHKGKEEKITIDESAGTFTIQCSGSYKFDGVASVFPSAGMLLNFSLFVNGVLIPQINTALSFKNSQDTNTFSGTGWIDLVKNDIVAVKGKTDSQPVSITIPNMNISISRRGN